MYLMAADRNSVTVIICATVSNAIVSVFLDRAIGFIWQKFILVQL